MSSESSTGYTILKFTRAVPDALAPTKGSQRAAGYDLRSPNDCVVPAHDMRVIDTKLKFQFPEGCYGRVSARCGNNFIVGGAGVIDEDYRGVVRVILFNHGEEPFDVKKGDRIAQIICERIYYPVIQHSALSDLTLTGKIILKFTRVYPDALTPTKGSQIAAGYDLSSAYDYVVPAGGMGVVDTGLTFEFPEGCYGRVSARSGLAVKKYIDVGAGVIHADNRGVVKVILFNHSGRPFVVKEGERIAQLICERIYYPDIQEAELSQLTSTNQIILKFNKAIPDAFPPTKGSQKAAGYDLSSADNYVVPARGMQVVDTGLKFELPAGCYGRVSARFGLAVNNFIDVGAVVIDADYRDVVRVTLFNHGEKPFNVKKGDRIAQLICERIYYPKIQEVSSLTETGRGEKGFGSSGINYQ